MRVFLKNLDGHACPTDIEPSDDVFTLSAKIEEKTGIVPSGQRLLYGGKLLTQGGCKVSDYNIQEGSTISIIHRGPLEHSSK